MGIENQIAQFGINAGRGIQSTVSNALTRNEDRRRYENRLAMVQQEQQRADDAAREAAEREYSAGGVKAYMTSGKDPRILQGWIQGAVQRGYITPEEAAEFNDDSMMRLAAEVGHDFTGRSGESKFGLTPMYGRRGDELIPYQLSSSGGATPIDLGEGVTPVRPLIRSDIGGSVEFREPLSGRPVVSTPKSLPPQNIPANVYNEKAAGQQAKRDVDIAADLGVRSADEQRQAKRSLIAMNTAYKALTENTQDLAKIYGRGEKFYPDVLRSDKGRELIAHRDRFVANLRLAEVGQLKGTGPITENEQVMLGQAATILTNPSIPAPIAERAIRESYAVMEGRATGTPMPVTQEDYDSLPSGAEYIDPDDFQRYRKP